MKKILRSCAYAVKGIRAAIRDQRNLKVLTAIAFLGVVAGFYFGITPGEWCVILLCIAFVMGMEMMNSAVEALVDLVTTEWKPLAGKVKDMAAGAVLIASLLALVIGGIIFSKYLF